MIPHSLSKLLPSATTCQRIDPEDVEHPAARLGLEVWRRQRGDRRFPAREDIKPRDVAPAMQHLSLLKVTGGDFLYRIVGDAVVRAYDTPLQNRKVGEISEDSPAFGAIVLPLLHSVVEDRAPVAIRGTTGHDALMANFTDYEALFLPLGPDDETVDHILVFSEHISRGFGPHRS